MTDSPSWDSPEGGGFSMVDKLRMRFDCLSQFNCPLIYNRINGIS